MDISKIFQQAQKLQEQMQESQKELEKLTVTGTAGGGMVKVTSSANMRIRNIEIEEQVYSDNDKEMLEDLIMAAINNALDNAKRKAEEITKNQTNDLLGGMNLNGFPFQK